MDDTNHSAATMDQANLVPVKYVGRKHEKRDNVAGTDLVWLHGQIHLVPPLIASKLKRHADVWCVVSYDEVDADPAAVGLVVTDDEVPSSVQQPVLDQEEDKPQSLDLPNLQGMTRADIVTYAMSQFQLQLPSYAKKEEMIQAVVSLANERANSASTE